MKRRTFLGAVAAAPTGALVGEIASAQQQDTTIAGDICRALAEFRKTIPKDFERDYVEHVVVPFFLTTVFAAERPALPMIDVVLSKENALPYDLYGLIYKDWKPTPDEGTTVFLQGLEHRGPDNLRKRIYQSAVTPDLYDAMYRDKVVGFFDHLFDQKFAGTPLMRHYLDYYFDLYWDLHVGVRGDAIPAEVRQIGESFNTVLAYRNPMDPMVHEHYMKVRARLDVLKTWIAARVDDVATGKVANPERTFVHYWLKNAGNGEHFRRKDVVFEAFHNFVALSQWGNTMFGIVSRLRPEGEGGDAAVRAAFAKTMAAPVAADGAPYSSLESFVMELFRVISPNGGSLSAVIDARASQYGESPFALMRAKYRRHLYAATPHKATSMDPRHWTNAEQFDPERYASVPTSAQIDETRTKEMGFPRCPFHITSLPVADGRKVALTNSGFGTVFGVKDGKAMPVCDYAGFAPFGFGYRRCPGEQLTINVFEDFLRKVWKEKIQFVDLKLVSAKKVPVGPTAVIEDKIGFRRA